MESVVEFCRNYSILTFFLLYFTVGRFSLLIVIVFSICPFWLCTLIIIGIEIIQVPIFYHFYSYMAIFFRKIKKFVLRRKDDESSAASQEEEQSQEDEPKGFFVSRFKSYGIPGIFVLSALPFKGCGVWSGILLGKTFGIDKKRLYFIVGMGLLLGNLFVMGFALLARQTALAFIETWDINPSIKSLFY